MKTITTFLCIALTTTLVMGQDVLRQRSNTRGLNLSVYGQYTWWTVSDFGTSKSNLTSLLKTITNDNTAGGGGGLRVGYGFNHRLEAFLQTDYSNVTGSSNKEYTTYLVHVDVGGRLNIGSTTSRLRPFIDLGGSLVGASLSDATYKITLAGIGGMAGGGVNYFLTIPIAINLRYSQSFGNFSSYYVNDVKGSGDKVPISTGRLSLGLTWYLRGGR